MCGIAGIVSFNKTISEREIKSMTDVIHHRGPDGEGIWLNKKNQVGLGHRRLAIIDLSTSGDQPMHYANERFTIVFNGEIYNYIEIREQLLAKGYTFDSQSDTEVLLALYTEKKYKCLDDLDGMFSFAIWDEYEQKLFCARDRFGEKPFYYYKSKDRFVFASEMKALWAAGVPKSVSEHQLFYYLNYNAVRNPNEPNKTFYKDIFSLEVSHYLTINLNGQLTKSQYWDLDLTAKVDISFDRAKEEFLSLFTKSIQRRLRSDVPVGSSLSGGLDSSSIVAMVSRIKGKGQIQKTFSARFENFEKDEGTYMSQIVKLTNAEDYYTWPDENKLFEDFEKMCYHQEEPFGSSSIFAQWEVMKLAKEQNVTVLLDGQGADEIGGGYEHYFRKFYGQLYRTNKTEYTTELKKYKEFHNDEYRHLFIDKLIATHPIFFQKVKNITAVKYFMKNSLLSKEFFVNNFRLPYPHIVQFDLSKDLKYNTLTYGLQDLLRFCDRNSMAFSREVRLPFLSHQLVEFLFSLPDNYKINGGVTKVIIRQSMRGIVPNEILDRKDKIGYEPPQKRWLASKNFIELIKDSEEKLKKQNIIQAKSQRFDNEEQWKILMAGYFLK